MVREKFAPALWRDMEREYLEGKYSVEESNIRQFALIHGVERSELEDFVRRNVRVRDGFAGFVEHCRAEGIGFVVVSSGLDLYIRPVLEQAGLGGVPFHSGHAEVREQGIAVTYAGPGGTPLTAGIKESYVRHHKRQGHTVFYLGDGLSDVVPAKEADVVLARSSLRRRLIARDRPHFPFEDFHDARRHLDAVRQRLGR